MLRNSGFLSETKLSFCLTAALWRLIESGVSIIGLEAVGKKKISACGGNQIPIPRSSIP